MNFRDGLEEGDGGGVVVEVFGEDGVKIGEVFVKVGEDLRGELGEI